MDFTDEIVVASDRGDVWNALVDFRRIAACVPGCEDVEELAPLARYRAVMKQRVGPFRVEVPLDITVDDVQALESIRAHARGRDRITGTSINATLRVTLAPLDTGARLAVATDLQVTGRLATLGYAVIRKRAEESFAEFARRLRASLEAA
jgi:carbon monoxide dehydrogenase subunit G